LRDQMIPEEEREVLVCAAENGEVILECPNCSFSGIPTVDVWRDELEIYFFFCHELLKGG
jgi:hypothetical protein